jgi:PAS domain S-box-containing protein
MSSNYISVRSNLNKLSRPPELVPLQLTKALVDRAPDAIFCVGADGQFLYVNEAACNLTEYSSQELLSKKLVDLQSDLTIAKWLKYWRNLQQESSLNFLSRYETKSGQIIPVEVVINHVEEGEFCCVYVKEKFDADIAPKIQECTAKLMETNRYLRQEVAQLKQKETQLEISLASVQSTLESTANGIVALSSTGEILSYNQKFIDMWQVPPGVILSKKCPHSQRFFEHQVKDPEAFHKSVWEEPIELESESYDILELVDGRTFAHHSKPHLLEGKIIGRVWSIWDISEFKLTNETFNQNENGFGAFTETTEAIVFIVRDSRLCYVNSSMAAIAGYTKEELLSKHFDLSQLIEPQKPAMQQSGNFPQYQELKIISKNGDKRWLACSLGMLDFGGAPAKLVTAIDITQHKNAEAEVRQALEQAKQLSELKERFVSMLCHQFRTPLNIVSFSADLLKRHVHKWAEDKQIPYLAHIQVAVEQIGQLLDEIQVFGKLEAVKLSFEPREIDLEQFCRYLVSQMELASNYQTQIVLVNTCDRQVYLDKKLLEPILNNLLSNAIKYSPDGSTVKFEIAWVEGQVSFQVTDSGIGIPERDRTKLFEPFHRGSNVGELPGTGLGLSMVKMLVEIHGGKITVVSEVDRGSTFTVVLPSEKIKTISSD